MTKYMPISSFDIDHFKKATWKNHIQSILVLGQLFFKYVVPKYIFRFYHISKSTNAIICNLHHTFPLVYITKTNTNTSIDNLLLVSRIWYKHYNYYKEPQ